MVNLDYNENTQLSDISEYTPIIAIVAPILMGIILYILPGWRKTQGKSDKNSLDIQYLDEWKDEVNRKLDKVINLVTEQDKVVSLHDYRIKIIEREHVREQEDRNRVHDRDRDTDKNNKNGGVHSAI